MMYPYITVKVIKLPVLELPWVLYSVGIAYFLVSALNT